jgi:L-aminopeptidase/D-esterase-like protein
VIYDLRLGDARVRPDLAMGYRAAAAARADGLAEGNAGVGAGASVGKVLGASGMMRGGVGAASAAIAGGWRIGAIAAVNAFGDVVDPATGAIVAGARRPDGAFADTVSVLAGGPMPPPYGPSAAVENTTLVAVVTDAPLSKLALGRVARMAHDGLARAIRPVHTQWDGDVAYAISTSAAEGPAVDASAAGAVAADVVARAILRAVLTAESHPQAPAAPDFGR